MSRTTGDGGVVLFFLVLWVCFCRLDRGEAMPPPQRLGEYKLEMPRLNSWSFVTLKAWLPQRFVSLFVVSSWPSGFFFLSSGWVGFPLPCFPSPRRCGSSFLWVGWVPLPRFPGVFPMVLGWVGGCVLCFCSPAISCILRLFSPSCT